MKALNNIRQKALLLLLLAAAGTVKAQSHEFAPVGAEWYYERLYREGWNYTGVAYDRFRSLRTIEINGWECKEIELYQHLDCDGLVNPYTELRYITQEGDQVYEVENGQRLLLYDFGKNPGESWYASKYDVEVFVIDTSTMILEDGSVRKAMQTFTLDDNLYINNIIEGIGMDRSLFPFYDWEGPPLCMHSQIRCYSEEGIPLIASDTECDYEIVAIDERFDVETVAMNTIVENFLRIDFSKMQENIKQIRISDAIGKTIFTKETSDTTLEIDFASKPKGMYLVQIVADTQTINFKFIKK